jgi:phage gp36-like protein
MSYLTQQDLEDELGIDRLVQLTDDDGSGLLNARRVEKALAFAVGTFEGYARTRYALPVPVTPKVQAVCLDLAVFHLFKSRAKDTEGEYKVRKDAHDAAVKFLTDVQQGKAALDVPAAEETTTNPASPDRVLKGNTSPVFTDDKLSGF